MLHGNRGQPHEAIGVRRAPRRQLFVLHRDQVAGQRPLRPVPERVDAQRLDVHSLLVHHAHSIGPENALLVLEQGLDDRLELRAFDDAQRVRHDAVRVNVYGPDPATAHRNGPPFRRAARLEGAEARIQEPAAEERSRRGSRC